MQSFKEGRFLKWFAPQPKKVLYLDGEMSAVAMPERLKRITLTEEPNPAANNNFHLITPRSARGSYHADNPLWPMEDVDCTAVKAQVPSRKRAKSG